MDSVWAVLSTFSAAPGGSQSTKEYDLAIKDHVQAIKQLLFANRQVVTTNFAEILAVRTSFPCSSQWLEMLTHFQNLDPANNSIAFLAILLITWDNNPTGPERSTLLDETLRFLLKFDPSQVRYTGQSFRKLLEDVVRGQRFSVRDKSWNVNSGGGANIFCRSPSSLWRL